MIKVDLDTDAISAALARALNVLSDSGMRDVMSEIGEELLDTTIKRIENGGPGPDGTPWAPKAESTYRRYVASGEGADRRTLIHMGYLSGHGLHYSFDSGFAELRVSALYGAVMQFGAAKGAFGPYSGISKKTGRKYSGVAPWGNIPARPFVGISQQNESDILDIISGALRSAFE
jgi:phage gpG-like protein